MKVDLAVDLEIQGFSGSGVSDYNSGLTNCIVTKNNVTQRPSINITEDGESIGALNDRARGLYYWENNSKKYIVHDNDVYETTQDSVAVGTITAGTERVTLLETLGATPYMVVLDAENDEGWLMNGATTVVAIASNFPSTLVHGGAVLDGFLLVMDEDGIIYNSTVLDPTTFPATGFKKAERENDKGVYLGKHHDNVVSFLSRSIEFLYNAKNSAGSPLNRRQDISYNIGCVSGLSVWENGDVIYFLGSNTTGQVQIYKLENFQITPISSDAINSYVTQGLTQTGLKISLNGLSAMGHDILILNVYTLTGASPGTIVPSISGAYDTLSNKWGFWKTCVNSHTTFPLVGWTKRTGGQNETEAARTGEGLFYNGDVIEINDDLMPVDTLLGTAVYEDDVYDVDVYATTEGAGSNIEAVIRIGLVTGETPGYKFQARETVEMENTPSTQTLTIKHSDESTNNFDSGNTIDTSCDRKEVHRGGRFMRRNYQLEYSGDEQFFMKYLDLDLREGL